MKNSLYLVSLIICLTLFSCLGGNGKNAKKNEDPIDSTHLKLPVDTMSEVVGEVKTGDSILVDSTILEEKPAKPDNTHIKKEIPQHRSPEQEEIDRIKAEKNKKKK